MAKISSDAASSSSAGAAGVSSSAACGTATSSSDTTDTTDSGSATTTGLPTSEDTAVFKLDTVFTAAPTAASVRDIREFNSIKAASTRLFSREAAASTAVIRVFTPSTSVRKVIICRATSFNPAVTPRDPVPPPAPAPPATTSLKFLSSNVTLSRIIFSSARRGFVAP